MFSVQMLLFWSERRVPTSQFYLHTSGSKCEFNQKFPTHRQVLRASQGRKVCSKIFSFPRMTAISGNVTSKGQFDSEIRNSNIFTKSKLSTMESDDEPIVPHKHNIFTKITSENLQSPCPVCFRLLSKQVIGDQSSNAWKQHTQPGSFHDRWKEGTAQINASKHNSSDF